MILADLKKEITYKWRVQSFSKNKPSATCVAYIDSRDVCDLLDEVVGPENWQRDHKEVKGNMFAGIGIKCGDEWIWKWDCGTESNQDAQKGESSDSFKRAAVQWGVGRFLYSLGIEYVNASEKKASGNFPYPVDRNNKRIYDLTTHINDKHPTPKLELITTKQLLEISALMMSGVFSIEETDKKTTAAESYTKEQAEEAIKSIKIEKNKREGK